MHNVPLQPLLPPKNLNMVSDDLYVLFVKDLLPTAKVQLSIVKLRTWLTLNIPIGFSSKDLGDSGSTL